VKDCYYINLEIRPNGWTPNPNIQKKIEKLFQRRPWLRTRYQKKAEDSDQETALLAANQPQTAFALTTVFKTTAGAKTVSYELKKSTILDSGATIHVCNDRTKFLDLTPASGSDELLTGDGVSRYIPQGYRKRFKQAKQLVSLVYSTVCIFPLPRLPDNKSYLFNA
jgi:hypothetical protein